ncbi:DUF982 domain-containing protein [Martelella endophytica]|uniref:DUF982 domain-containing protein n=1 Tax=Martelella endophytica TaxID=1486262 RepID=UPI0005F10FC6|nr:DUF982 domain-containing protein [Martelella endophytica]
MTRLIAFWTSPVHIRAKDGHTLTIEGPSHAEDVLKSRWPVKQGPHFENALELCVRAGEQPGHLGQARDAFVAAALEAGMLQTSRKQTLKTMARKLNLGLPSAASA